MWLHGTDWVGKLKFSILAGHPLWMLHYDINIFSKETRTSIPDQKIVLIPLIRVPLSLYAFWCPKLRAHKKFLEWNLQTK